MDNMEVKKQIPLQAKELKFNIQEVVKRYYEHTEAESNSEDQVFLKKTANLAEIEEHSEAGVLSSLNKRISYGVPYTKIGKDLIAVNCEFPGGWFFNKDVKSNNLKTTPHPYSISLNAYLAMKENLENQIVVTIGVSGSGKTFNVIHVLDHLITISTEESITYNSTHSLFEYLHKSVQLLHIMGSVMKKHNLESTTCALDISVQFDSGFLCVGGRINAELLDICLPSPKKNRSFQLLHSIMHCDMNTLKILGLSTSLPYKIFGQVASSEDLRIFDIEVNQRFFECLEFIGVSLAEKKNFLATLASVIFLYEMEFVVKTSHIEPKNRTVLKKLCKCLGVAEGVFVERFLRFETIKKTEDRCKDFARFLYNKAFCWLGDKINKRLAEVSKQIVAQRKEFIKLGQSVTPAEEEVINKQTKEKYMITFLDFPGFTKEKSLGGLGINLAFESLNYFCGSNYIKLLTQLDSQKVKIANLAECRSKSIVEFFMNSDSNFMHNLSASEKDFRRYVERISLETPSILLLPGNDLRVNFTLSPIVYNLDSLRQESLQHFYPDFYSNFLKSCSSQILASKAVSSQNKLIRLIPNCEEMFSASLRKILMPYLDLNPFVMYCMKTEGKVLNRRCFEFIRNSLIIPSLVWEWFGFLHWVSLKDLIRELRLNPNSTPAQIKAELKARLGWTDPEVTENYILLKPHHMKEFKAHVNQKRKKSEDPISDLSMSLNLFSQTPQQNFSLIIHDESDTQPNKFPTRETLLHNSFKRIDLDKTFTDPSFDSTKSTGKEFYSLSTSIQDSVIVWNSQQGKVSPFKVKLNYAKVDYSRVEGRVLKIQKVWRGHCARVYVNALRRLHEKAVKIQSVWRGVGVRRQIGPILRVHKAAMVIQRAWRVVVLKRKAAARKIQKAYRRFKQRKYEEYEAQTPGYPSSKKILNNNIKKNRRNIENNLSKGKTSRVEVKEKNPKKEKNHTPVHHMELYSDKHTNSSLNSSYHKQNSSPRAFSPAISDTSKLMARKKFSQFSEISTFDRFRILEANRVEKIHKQRQDKLEAEAHSHTPKINVNENIRNSFSQRLEKYLKDMKTKQERNLRKEVKEVYSFQPNANKVDKKREQGKIVEDLFKWAKNKEARLKKAREIKMELEVENDVKFKMSPNSIGYSTSRKLKIQEESMKTQRIVRDNSPYWPSYD